MNKWIVSISVIKGHFYEQFPNIHLPFLWHCWLGTINKTLDCLIRTDEWMFIEPCRNPAPLFITSIVLPCCHCVIQQIRWMDVSHDRLFAIPSKSYSLPYIGGKCQHWTKDRTQTTGTHFFWWFVWKAIELHRILNRRCCIIITSFPLIPGTMIISAKDCWPSLLLSSCSKLDWPEEWIGHRVIYNNKFIDLFQGQLNLGLNLELMKKVGKMHPQRRGIVITRTSNYHL